MNKSEYDTKPKRKHITEIVKVIRSSYENDIITYDQYIRMKEDWDPSLDASLTNGEIDQEFYDSLVKRKEGPDLAPTSTFKERVVSGAVDPVADAADAPTWGGGRKRKKYSKGRSKFLKKRKKYSKKRSKYSKNRLKKRKSSKRR